MKIIQSGLLNRRGIVIQCKFCKCVYMIENKKDWEGSVVLDLSWYKIDTEAKKYVNYQCSCPECGEIECFGINHNEYNNDEGIHFVKVYPIFDRDDWEERYKLSVEEVEK